ncbi:glycosyltransferase [Glaciihabitans sp. dw_435]|uniref:glycosyltransferase n=1 Tax=Glaciihabitans sp. dw_435 TaxID=2720081 RepID=UPI001BD46170|nr:glycosyltransferase [Glaciihabitans sp. dw_435]
MRIVHVAGFYGPPSEGLRTTLRQLGAGYRRAGHEFVVIVPGSRHSRVETAYGTRITVPSLPVIGAALVEHAVRRTLIELQPDRLEVSDRLTLRRLGVWARRHGIPAVMFSDGAPSGWVLRMATPHADRPRPSLANYDRIVCTTAAAAVTFDTLLPGRVTEVPLGVDLEVFTPLRWSAEQRHTYTNVDGVLLVAVGRLSPEKAPERALDTLRELIGRGIPASLVFVGDGPLRERLERASDGLPVGFAGFVEDRRELATLLASADVALALGTTETFSVGALETLASGTPVVAAAGSSLAELLTDGAGELADPTPAGFADAVERLLDIPVENRRTSARLRASLFPWSRTVTAMLAVHGGTVPPETVPVAPATVPAG